MKKVSLVFAVLAVLSLVVVGACGGDNGTQETTKPSSSQTTQPTSAPQSTQPSNGGGGGLTWNDMPVYGGADQIQRGTWSIPADEGDYSKVEWRYYETGDDLDDVVNFYKDKMPDNGWTEVMWMDAGDVAWGMYMKNNEKDAAYVWMMAEGGDTVIALMRATE
ncbi:MAG TPA: hypothetical protein G4O16_10125 [Dehalococcoidia bacterium]|nr:hypothetical protein [Dehalococcoidia bacterium]